MFNFILGIIFYCVVYAIYKNPSAKEKAMELIEKEQGGAQKRRDAINSRIKKLSDEELERKVKKAYIDEGKRDTETLMMVQEYNKRKKN